MLSVIDYGPGLTTMAQTNLLKLDRVQNEAMQESYWEPPKTAIETRRLTLDLPPTEARQKVEQVKAYFSDVGNPHSPLHEAAKDTKGCRLGQTGDSILQVCQLTELKQTKVWERHTNRFRCLYETLLPENLEKHCREWPTDKTESEIKLFIILRKQQTARPRTVY